MNNFQSAFQAVQKLASDFSAEYDFHVSAEYTEPRVRKDFVDKLLIALGWDVNNERHPNPFEQEVRVEHPVKTGAANRHADYAFHVAPNFRDIRFVIEAKKPYGDITTKDNYFQAIRYGWNLQNALAGLTDFEHFHLLDCRYKPDIETATHHCVEKWTLSDYCDRERFARLYWLVSREAVAGGSLEKFAETLPRPRGGAKQRGLFAGAYLSIDDSFLEQLDEHRKTLARVFKNRNPHLDSATLTEATQRTLDRLVFMRFLEDKLIEPTRFVSKFGERGTAWQDFVSACRRLDSIYNGIVFKKHAILDAPDFRLDDNAFANICEDLSHKNSPYDFNAIPIHILGSIYERFLGNVIVATDKRVQVEPKPEVRKAGGVYYTPAYVVRYIVENTVGKLISGKSPDEIAAMRFADISCGSGSFLIDVYDLLLRYHARYYNENPRKARKNDCVTKDGVLHLSLEKKRDILLNNIYGVDIDAQAVEVTQLSLYLKLLDEETIASAHGYQLRIHAAILPSLSTNIVCGNSLIGRDILEGQLFADESERKLNPMNFEDAFPEIMKQGGFDAIVGNPPYIRVTNIDADLRPYLYKTYDINHRFDIYVVFVKRAFSLICKRGVFGFILPNKFFTSDYGSDLRALLAVNQAVSKIVDFGDSQVFSGATIYTCLLFLSRTRQESLQYIKATTTRAAHSFSASPATEVLASRLSQAPWAFVATAIGEMLDRLDRFPKLGDLCEIKHGLQTGLDSVFLLLGSGGAGDGRNISVVSEREAKAFKIERAALRRVVKGAVDLRRYLIEPHDRYVLFPYEIRNDQALPIDQSQFKSTLPLAWAYLTRHAKALRSKKKPGQWYGFRRRNYDLRDGVSRILVPSIAQRASFVADCAGEYHYVGSGGGGGGGYGLSLRDGVQVSIHFLLGILNSRFIDWIIKLSNSRFGHGYYSFNRQYIEPLPIPLIDFADNAATHKHDRIAAFAKQMLDVQKRLFAARTDKDKHYYEAKSAALDREIDAAVFDLYGLSKAEIETIDGDVSPQAGR